MNTQVPTLGLSPVAVLIWPIVMMSMGLLSVFSFKTLLMAVSLMGKRAFAAQGTIQVRAPLASLDAVQTLSQAYHTLRH